MTGKCNREQEVRTIKTKHKVKDRSTETSVKFTSWNRFLLFLTN